MFNKLTYIIQRLRVQLKLIISSFSSLQLVLFKQVLPSISFSPSLSLLFPLLPAPFSFTPIPQVLRVYLPQLPPPTFQQQFQHRQCIQLRIYKPMVHLPHLTPILIRRLLLLSYHLLIRQLRQQQFDEVSSPSDSTYPQLYPYRPQQLILNHHPRRQKPNQMILSWCSLFSIVYLRALQSCLYYQLEL